MGELPLHEEDPLNVVDLSCLRRPVAGVGPNFLRSPLGIHRREVDPVILHGVASPEAQPPGTHHASSSSMRSHCNPVELGPQFTSGFNFQNTRLDQPLWEVLTTSVGAIRYTRQNSHSLRAELVRSAAMLERSQSGFVLHSVLTRSALPPRLPFREGLVRLQGYLAHTKQHPPLGSPQGRGILLL